MTQDEAVHWLREVGNPCVRINRRQEAGYGHFGVARMLAIMGENAKVQPFGHGHDETVPLDRIHIWTSKLPPGVKMYTPKPQNRFAPMKPLTQKLGDLIINKKEEEPVQTQHKKEWKPGERKYTDTQYDEARKLKKLGKTWPEIAVITGVPQPALYAMLSPEFAVKRQILSSPEKKQKARTMYNAGVKTQTIADEVGMAYQTVWTWIQQWKDEPTIEVTNVMTQVHPPKKEEKEQRVSAEVVKAKHTIYSTIRSILQLPIPDTSKLLAIEGIVSHE